MQPVSAITLLLITALATLCSEVTDAQVNSASQYIQKRNWHNTSRHIQDATSKPSFNQRVEQLLVHESGSGGRFDNRYGTCPCQVGAFKCMFELILRKYEPMSQVTCGIPRGRCSRVCTKVTLSQSASSVRSCNPSNHRRCHTARSILCHHHTEPAKVVLPC